MNPTVVCKCGKRVSRRYDGTLIAHRRPSQNQRGSWCKFSDKHPEPLPPNPNDQGLPAWVAS